MSARFDHRSGRHIEVDSARIYVETQGPDDAPAVVLLHGGMGTIHDFDEISSRFRSPVRLVGIDSRGHGASTLGSEPLTYARLASDVEAVAKALGLARVHVLGFSDGGVVALRLAAAGRMKIEKVVAIGTPWQLTKDDPLRAIYAEITGESWRNKFPDGYERYQKLNPAPDFDALTSAAVKMWLDDSPTGYPEASLKDIEQEILVVRGDEDHLITRASSFGLVERLSSAKLLVLPYAGHAVQDDQPETLIHFVSAFFDAVDEPAGT